MRQLLLNLMNNLMITYHLMEKDPLLPSLFLKRIIHHNCDGQSCEKHGCSYGLFWET